MFRISLCLAAAMISGSAFAHDFKINGIVVDHPWSRATPPGAKVAAGYMEVQNTSDRSVRLVGGSAAFATVVVHEMKVEDGVMRMSEVDGGIEIPAGETVTLTPGGLHLMFIDLQEPFLEGEMREATLDFGDAGTVTVEFSVAEMGAMHHQGAAD